jgi:hypothetical protein
MASIRDYYRKKRLILNYSTLFFAIIVLLVLFLFSPYYYANVRYLNDNRDTLYKQYYKDAEQYARDETYESKKEALENNKEKYKEYSVDNKKIKDEFERHLFWLKNNYLLFSILTIVVLIFFLYKIFEVILVHKPLYCPNCYNTVLQDKILPFLCPFCKTENKLFKYLYTRCSNINCKSPIPSIICPECGEQIDLLCEYDFKKIKEKRYGKKSKI